MAPWWPTGCVVKTPYPCTPEKLVDNLVDLVAPLPAADAGVGGIPGDGAEGPHPFGPPLLHGGRTGTQIDDDLVKLWDHFDLAGALRKRLGKPTKVANDADVQGSAVVSGKGLEVVITLGTGVGTAFFYDGRLLPHMEFAHTPFRKGENYNEQLGELTRKEIGNGRWNKRVRRAIETFRALTFFDHCYIGGGQLQAPERGSPPRSHHGGQLGRDPRGDHPLAEPKLDVGPSGPWDGYAADHGGTPRPGHRTRAAFAAEPEAAPGPGPGGRRGGGRRPRRHRRGAELPERHRPVPDLHRPCRAHLDDHRVSDPGWGPRLRRRSAGTSGPAAAFPSPFGRGVKAVTIVDGELEWAVHPDLVAGDTELVVAVKAAGVNAADLMQRQGFYPAPPSSPPDIPGMELAGEVVAVGSHDITFQTSERGHGGRGRRPR